MDIETSSAIRLFFPNPSLALVYYEAIANALDAGATNIAIHISIEAFTQPESLNISIEDNGAGFTPESFDRFRTLLKPRDKFHKGVGRLVFLNYFDAIEVLSEWGNNRRDFVFRNGFDGTSHLTTLPERVQRNTTRLTFKRFSRDKINSYEDLKPASLKEKVIFQFLPTLNDMKERGVDFKIELALTTAESNAQKSFLSGEVSIAAEDLPDLQVKVIEDDAIDVFSQITLHYLIKETSAAGDLTTAVSIDGRTIPIGLLAASAMPPGYSAIFIITTPLIGISADSSRQKLVLSEGISESTFYSILRREIGKVLNESIPQIAETNGRIRREFEDRFPHLLGFFDESVVGLIDRDDALDAAQRGFFLVQKEILQCNDLSDAAFRKSLEVSSRTLTEYILYREKIIAKMKSMTPHNSEEEIHNLIVPKRREFVQETFADEVYRNNAWLMDDKFMTFRTILSEANMEAVIGAILRDDERRLENGRPDIAMIFSADPSDAAPVDVVVVEIKKKTESEKENQFAINQLLERADKLARYCPNIQRIWYYAVLEINSNFARSLMQQKWAPLFSKGKIFYQEFPTYRDDGSVVPTPIFAMTFDAVISDAQARNHTFLEILRSTIKRHVAATTEKDALDKRAAS